MKYVCKKSVSTINQSSKKQHGISLLELMATTAILSALVAISLPIYQGYRLSAKIGVGISAMVPLKTAVNIHYQTNGIWPVDNAEANAKPPTFYSNEYVIRSTVKTEPHPGSITISYNNQVLRTLNGHNTIIFYPVINGQQVEWKCDEGTLPKRYRPAPCSI